MPKYISMRAGLIFLAICCVVAYIAVTLPSEPTTADIVFTAPTISSRNTVLFSSRTHAPRYNTYSTLFEAEIGADNEHRIRPITYFPEHISIIPHTGELIIQNRYGLYRSDVQRTQFFAVDGYPHFANGDQIRAGNMAPFTHSPDGKYYIYYQHHSATLGRLILHEVDSGKKIVITRNVGVTLGDTPARWSPDSRHFMYTKDNTLYYYSLKQAENNAVIDEQLRAIGPGTLQSAQWGANNRILYLLADTIYNFNSGELFAQGVYQDIIRPGAAVGMLPFPFNPSLDTFSLSPQNNRLLLIKNSRDLFVYFLRQRTAQGTQSSLAIPYNQLATDAEIKHVVWPHNDLIIFLAEDLGGNSAQNRIYRALINQNENDYALNNVSETGIRSIALSPSRRFIALVGDEDAIVKDPATWETISAYDHPLGISALWTSIDQLIIAGAYTIEQRSPTAPESQLITLSQVDDYTYSTEEEQIVGRVDDQNYFFNIATGHWSPITLNISADEFPKNNNSQNYRIYVEEISGERHRNRIQIRHLQGHRTTTLITSPVSSYEPFPHEDEQVNLTNFAHGSRIRNRKVAFAINLIDSADGLNAILATLRDYGIHTTFFVNGNFITNYPRAIRAVTRAGHEVGSLFFNYFDLTDNRYDITPQFIQEGLSSTEDLYHAATQQELSLLWHAPYYSSNPEIINSASQLGYTYIGRDIDSSDITPTRGIFTSNRRTHNPWALIERIIAMKRPGSIISIRVGRAELGVDTEGNSYRHTYLYQHLPLLINLLIEQGYSVVPVSELIAEAQ